MTTKMMGAVALVHRIAGFRFTRFRVGRKWVYVKHITKREYDRAGGRES